MDAKQIIEVIKQNPTETFHTFKVGLDENKDKILEELNEFCKESGYHLSIAYYPKNNDHRYDHGKTFKVRITAVNDQGLLSPTSVVNNHQYPTHGFEREEPNVLTIMMFSIIAVVLAIGYISFG